VFYVFKSDGGDAGSPPVDRVPEVRTSRWLQLQRCPRCLLPVIVSVLPTVGAALKVSVPEVRLALKATLSTVGTEAAAPMASA